MKRGQQNKSAFRNNTKYQMFLILGFKWKKIKTFFFLSDLSIEKNFLNR